MIHDFTPQGFRAAVSAAVSDRTNADVGVELGVTEGEVRRLKTRASMEAVERAMRKLGKPMVLGT